jgi:hypothetical protein
VSERPVRHVIRLLVLGLVLGAALYAGYLAMGAL